MTGLGPSILCYLAVLSCVGRPCAGFRALLYPCNIPSHYLYFGRLGVALLEEGHEVALLAADNAKLPSCLQESNITVHVYETEGDQPYVSTEKANRRMVGVAKATSIIESITLLRELTKEFFGHFDYECTKLLQNNTKMTELDKSEYDVAIMDLGGIACLYTIPYKLNIPYVTLSVETTGWIYSVPSLPSFTPSTLSDRLSDDMNFVGRLENFAITVISYLLMNSTSYYTQKYVPEKPTLTGIELFQRSKLWLILGDSVVGYPSASMPNTLEIGDVILSKPTTLSLEWRDFLDNSPEGVILLSFGTFLDFLPDEIVDKLCRVFQKVKQIIIWKSKNPHLCEIEGMENKIKVTNWMPQNDLLAHPKVKLFMTHCGKNSILEAVYHAKPMIGMPLFLDQPYNANLIKYKGYGMKINLWNFKVDELVEDIQNVTTNTYFKKNIERASAILRDKPESAGQRASHWIRHVLEHGDDHLRTKAFNLHPAQFFMFDIFLFVLVLVSILLSVFVLMCYCCVRCVWGYCTKRNTDKDKAD